MQPHSPHPARTPARHARPSLPWLRGDSHRGEGARAFATPHHTTRPTTTRPTTTQHDTTRFAGHASRHTARVPTFP
nr:hypothetical protein [Human alphaherpesvirus 2]QBH84582.1 hypothetical protein [Human alphaherpesvirus 2]QXO36684.1 hypothetical protein GPADPEBJ_00003 [Human alphaherpesvirus 2]